MQGNSRPKFYEESEWREKRSTPNWFIFIKNNEYRNPLLKITCNFSKESIHFAPLLKLHVILAENLFFKFNLNAIHVFEFIKDKIIYNACK